MSKVCQVTGKRPISGNNVSHSHRKTRRRFLPNLVNVTLHSETLARSFKMRIAASTLRTVDKHGGLDGYLLKTKTTTLHEKAQKILSDIEKKQAEATA